jgi:hypothetical protein
VPQLLWDDAALWRKLESILSKRSKLANTDLESIKARLVMWGLNEAFDDMLCPDKDILVRFGDLSTLVSKTTLA